MPVGGEKGVFPPISGLHQQCMVTHTHTHFMHLCTLLAQEIGLLIALGQILKDSRGLVIEGLVW